tara:strand:- start:25 stop:297 length:273 start_codon:yes stop_codon:yes gene_type:complete
MKWIEVNGNYYNLATASMVVEDKCDVYVYFPGASAKDDSGMVNGKWQMKIKWTPIILCFSGREGDAILNFIKSQSEPVMHAERSVLLGAI